MRKTLNFRSEDSHFFLTTGYLENRNGTLYLTLALIEVCIRGVVSEGEIWQGSRCKEACEIVSVIVYQRYITIFAHQLALGVTSNHETVISVIMKIKCTRTPLFSLFYISIKVFNFVEFLDFLIARHSHQYHASCRVSALQVFVVFAFAFPSTLMVSRHNIPEAKLFKNPS